MAARLYSQLVLAGGGAGRITAATPHGVGTIVAATGPTGTTGPIGIVRTFSQIHVLNASPYIYSHVALLVRQSDSAILSGAIVHTRSSGHAVELSKEREENFVPDFFVLATGDALLMNYTNYWLSTAVQSTNHPYHGEADFVVGYYNLTSSGTGGVPI